MGHHILSAAPHSWPEMGVLVGRCMVEGFMDTWVMSGRWVLNDGWRVMDKQTTGCWVGKWMANG